MLLTELSFFFNVSLTLEVQHELRSKCIAGPILPRCWGLHPELHHHRKRDWEHQTHFVFAAKRPWHYLLNFREFNWSNQENPGSNYSKHCENDCRWVHTLSWAQTCLILFAFVYFCYFYARIQFMLPFVWKPYYVSCESGQWWFLKGTNPNEQNN